VIRFGRGRPNRNVAPKSCAGCFALKILRATFWGKSVMTDLPVALADEAEAQDAATRSNRGAWIETALSVLFTMTAVLLVALVAVVSNL
jgi:hypothetical protein